jgi:hypothetical protein
MNGLLVRSGVALSTALLLACGATAQTPAGATVGPPAARVPLPQASPAADQAAFSTTPNAARNGEAVSLGTVTMLPSDAPDPSITPAPGFVADQVLAVVNGDLILESDVLQEQRFEAFTPFSTPGAFSRDAAVQRLIDRTLILQQSKLQPDQGVTIEEARAQLQMLRKDLPGCKVRCETEAGWQQFVHDQGFTMQELEQRWQSRMEVLKFIEMRFRSGIEITPAQIKTYYEKNMLPEYAKVHAAPPKLEVISPRIQEVLLEQQVSSLLSDWLQSLKAQGDVHVMRPDEVEP